MQGFYRNKYGALLHYDTNKFGESWTLLRSAEDAAWAQAAGLEIKPRDGGDGPAGGVYI